VNSNIAQVGQELGQQLKFAKAAAEARSESDQRNSRFERSENTSIGTEIVTNAQESAPTPEKGR
jgi:hypothetical protein